MKKRLKKLVLKKETVMALQGDLQKVAGGATTSRGDAVTCVTCGACYTDLCETDTCTC